MGKNKDKNFMPKSSIIENVGTDKYQGLVNQLQPWEEKILEEIAREFEQKSSDVRFLYFSLLRSFDSVLLAIKLMRADKARSFSYPEIVTLLQASINYREVENTSRKLKESFGLKGELL